VFDPEKKTALVLGCGGVAGAAWSIAMLDEIERTLGFDARRADVLVGTSAGAVLAALLGADVPVSMLVASQRGEASAACWDHERDTGGAFPPLPGLRLTGAGLLRAGLRGRIPPFTAALGALPTGRADMGAFERLVDRFVPSGAWSEHRATWIMAVDAETGERVPFGRSDAPRIPLRAAVCASYGVPGWCPPVTHAGRTYVDGGIASPTSADMVADEDVAQVIVLAPMASSNPGAPRSALERIERRARRYMTSIVDREVRLLRARGLAVLRFEPGPEDLAAFGYNMMDPARRKRVFDTARLTARAQVAAIRSG
jgi:NTE family protein